MDIINATAEAEITAKWDGRRYVFFQNQVTPVPDEAGKQLLAKWGKLGLSEVHYGDDMAEIQLKCCRSRLQWMQAQVDKHNAVNARQKELNFPVLVKPHQIAQFEVAIPVYEEFVSKAEKEMGVAEDERYKRQLREAFKVSMPEIPEFRDMTIQELRAECSRRDLAYPANANKQMLLKLLRDKKVSSGQVLTNLKVPQPNVG